MNAIRILLLAVLVFAASFLLARHITWKRYERAEQALEEWRVAHRNAGYPFHDEAQRLIRAKISAIERCLRCRRMLLFEADAERLSAQRDRLQHLLGHEKLHEARA